MQIMRKNRELVNVMLACLVGASLLVGCGDGGSDLVRSAAVSNPIASPKSLGKANLQYYWKSQVVLSDGEQITRMYNLGDKLYFLTNRRNLVAMDAMVGIPEWVVNITRRNEKIFPPIIKNNVRLSEKVGTVEDIKDPPAKGSLPKIKALMINTSTRLLVIDRDTGKIYRDFTFKKFSATNRGSTDGERYYVASSSKMYYAVTLLPAVARWWEEINDEIIKAPMACYGRRLYMGTMSGTFRVDFAGDIRERFWEKPLDGPISTEFHVDSRGAFIGCGDGNIYALNLNDGRNLWDPVQVKGDIKDPIRVGELTIFQHVHGDGLYAINLANGTKRWRLPQGRKVLATVNGDVYVLGKDNKLVIVNEITGDPKASVLLSGFDFFAENLAAPAVYTATRDGRVFCIRSKDAGRLTVEDIKARQ
ncbi:MAG: PQQ-like beta-propeller repeat protein [Phycisphaerae bacterium]|nr:PQQ-like beta-propeller repeat protein [Phycisphaerae bacterium]